MCVWGYIIKKHYDYEVDFGWEDNFGFVESVNTNVVMEVSWRICCLYFA